MKSLFAAIRFLTILPVPMSWAGTEHHLAGSVKYFPVVGLLIGVICAVVAWLVTPFFVMPLAAVLIVIALIVITGGLHLDGLADTADGFLSVSSRQRSLEIMKDSHTGAMGVIAIVCVVLVKITALAAVGESRLLGTVLLMPVAGRCAQVFAISVLPYIRDESGLGSVFCKNRTILNGIWAVAAVVVIGWLLLGSAGIAGAGGAVLVMVLFAIYCHWKIGGITGDTIGAISELTEAVVPLAVLVSLAKL